MKRIVDLEAQIQSAAERSQIGQGMLDDSHLQEFECIQTALKNTPANQGRAEIQKMPSKVIKAMYERQGYTFSEAGDAQRDISFYIIWNEAFFKP